MSIPLTPLQRIRSQQVGLVRCFPSIEYVYSALRKDGSIVQVGTNSSLANYHGAPAIIGLMQDISDKKVAEDHIRRYAKQLENTFIQTVVLATTISEMRDPYTAGHESRVGEIAAAKKLVSACQQDNKACN